jgi:hypothetical protein
MPTSIQTLLEQLRACGLDADSVAELASGEGCAAIKVVCVPSSLEEGLNALGETPRDQVVMVRVDSDTIERLDAWVDTGALKSRSHAAALFIREGLRVRDTELSELDKALSDLQEAKSRLREEARKVLGPEAEEADTTGTDHD